jgi:hypothetical protein
MSGVGVSFEQIAPAERPQNTSKRKRVDLQFLRATREEKAARTESVSLSIIRDNKAAHDAKTARFKRQREKRQAREAEVESKKGEQ